MCVQNVCLLEEGGKESPVLLFAEFLGGQKKKKVVCVSLNYFQFPSAQARRTLSSPMACIKLTFLYCRQYIQYRQVNRAHYTTNLLRLD